MRKQTKKWKTKDGRKIRICDMSDNHLKNTINLLHRFGNMKHWKTLSFYLTCPEPTADAASMAFEQEFNQVLDSTSEDYVPAIYWDMINDAERRGLKVELGE